MASDRELRIKAGFTLAKLLAERRTREMFDSNGYRDEQPIVVALESDTLQDVYSRLQRHTPPAIVAIYWPNDDILRFTQLEPSLEPADYSPDRDDVRGGSTIGMLWEHVDRQQGGRFRFRLEWGQPALNVVRLEHASA